MTADGRPASTAAWFARGLGVGVALGVVVFLAAGAVGDTPAAVLDTTPRFIEETVPSGVRHTYDGGFEFFVGGGVAVFDCDGDGREDLYLAGGANRAALYRNDGAIGGPLHFEQVDGSDVGLTGVTGAYPVDIDSDGRLDLAVLRVGENVLFRGQGDCRFERANEEWSFDGGDEWTVGFSATWEGSAGFPTLAVGNYLEVPGPGETASTCSDSALYRPDGEGYGPPTALKPGWCTLSVLFSDWGRTGRRDLRMTNDRHYYQDGEEQLWRIDPDGPPRLYTHEEGWQAMTIWGMGIATHDVTGDGLPEVFLTSQGDNKLQTLAGAGERPEYTDIAIRRGVTAHRPFMGGEVLPSTAWHPEFDDVDNDGLLDLFISKGNVEAQAGYAVEDPSNLLFANPDGTFTDGARSAGIVSVGRGRGAALADFNLDGMLDLIEVNRARNVRLWRNVGLGDGSEAELPGNWLAVRLSQEGSNRDAIGSWIEVRTGAATSRREVTIGGGHAGGGVGWIHLGLGEADGVELRVVWPDGEAGPWMDVAGNDRVVVRRGAEAPELWVGGDGE